MESYCVGLAGIDFWGSHPTSPIPSAGISDLRHHDQFGVSVLTCRKILRSILVWRINSLVCPLMMFFLSFFIDDGFKDNTEKMKSHAIKTIGLFIFGD